MTHRGSWEIELTFSEVPRVLTLKTVGKDAAEQSYMNNMC